MSKSLHTFTADLLTRAGKALSELLNHPIAFKEGELAPFLEPSLAPFGEAFIACLTAAVTEPCAGTVYIGFDLKRVVLLGALLEMVPPEGIAERLSDPKFDKDNADAFEEVGNILVGKLDEAIRDNLGAAKIHTKKGETISGAPAELFGKIHAHGDYYCLAATVEIEGQEGGPVCFLFQPSLVEEGLQADPEISQWRISTAVKREDAAARGDAVSTAATNNAKGAPVAAATGPTAEGQQDTPGTRAASDRRATGDPRPPIVPGTADQPADGEPAAGPAPATMATSDATWRPRTTAARVAAGNADGRPVLLVVDDDITTRAILRTWLDGGDLLVYEAVSWREASIFLRHHRIDAILLDLYLHDLNGIEACHRLHLHPTTRDVPVILCASHPSREAVVQGLKAGAMDFLIKPFDRQRLMEKLEAITVTAV
ncbi:MAG: hypothetical protein COZ96_08770 [Nitrospirae bacterium CG_4_8_14_3_um_filter_70_85]|nr:response regulator [Deltaproteobacteria bacterium]PIU79047.1 MAG: hypothetical protein COS73_05165 [Nitrospirae bacterium CG06_land_8_20_14_3_00_70_43]PIW82459.1 MAG: hypothetical protein COZ96_08770 [Nitrospirae bacterium CG_4_8_14_3_um_filter_70_85]PIX83344.1 MAG: hypothetical protein COZ33_05955 [Nitrospirae bacterium CG_4_10_14_3_um_filter_70_108]